MNLDQCASIAFARWSTTTTWQTSGTRLETDCAIQTAESNFATAAHAITIFVNAAMATAATTTEDNVFLIDRVGIKTATAHYRG